MSADITSPTRATGVATARRVFVGLGVTALVLVAAGVGIWRAGERPEEANPPSAASAPLAAAGPAAFPDDDNLIPHRPITPPSGPAAVNSAADLTVYIVASEADRGAQQDRHAALNRLRVANGAPELSAVVMVAASAAEEARLGQWVDAVRNGLGQPVHLIDLRTATSDGALRIGDVRLSAE